MMQLTNDRSLVANHLPSQTTSAKMSGKSPPNIDGMTSLKVGNISYRTRTLDLHHIFGKFGDVGDVYIPRDKHSKHSRGFAFVR